eukprot:2432706-Rhodomonas_salina.3
MNSIPSASWAAELWFVATCPPPPSLACGERVQPSQPASQWCVGRGAQPVRPQPRGQPHRASCLLGSEEG